MDWPGAWLSSDGTRLFCWFRANDAESVRLVLRHQGFSDAEVWRASAGGRSPAEHRFEDTSDPQRTVEIKTQETGEATVVVRPGNGPWRCNRVAVDPDELFATVNAPVPEKKTSTATPSSVDFDVLIIGAGVSGLCALWRFLDMGLSVRCFERASDVGGVWHWNRYPGARVDSESHTYLYSFSDELIRDWDWQELFAPQPEIEHYLKHVVERFDLRRHIRFDTNVENATYDEAGHRWFIETDKGERISARFLVAATGTLSTPQFPDIEGIGRFTGESHHTGRWPRRGVELAGKRVGVIGTGATGVQVIQTIAEEVDKLTVFQRTPTFCVPQRNRPLTAEDREAFRRRWPEILDACETSYGGFIHRFDERSGLAVSADEREEKFEAIWRIPGFAFWFSNFADLMMNDEVNEHASDFVRRKIRQRVHDPAVADKLMPEHPFGSKRVPLENGYYEIYNRANVELVDLRETPVVEITSNGIRTTDRHYDCDVIIYATGFDAGTGALTRIDVHGEAGFTIAEKWHAGPETFLGMMVDGFPNFFMINGPQNAATLCNAGRCIEQNVEWLADCIEQMQDNGLTRIRASAEAARRWTDHVIDAAEGSVLGRMKESWFFGANTPGKPNRIAVYAPGAKAFRDQCDRVAESGYAGCEFT